MENQEEENLLDSRMKATPKQRIALWMSTSISPSLFSAQGPQPFRALSAYGYHLCSIDERCIISFLQMAQFVQFVPSICKQPSQCFFSLSMMKSKFACNCIRGRVANRIHCNLAVLEIFGRKVYMPTAVKYWG